MEFPLKDLGCEDPSLSPLQRWACKFFHCAQETCPPGSPFAGPGGKCMAAFKTPGKFMAHLIEHHGQDEGFHCFYCSSKSAFTSLNSQNQNHVHRGTFEWDDGHDQLFKHLIMDHTQLEYVCGLCPYRASSKEHIAYHGFTFHNEEYIKLVKDILKMNDKSQGNNVTQPIDLTAIDSLGFPVIYSPPNVGSGEKPVPERLIGLHKVSELTDIPQLTRFQCVYCTVIKEHSMDLMQHLVQKHPHLPLASYELAPEFTVGAINESEIKTIVERVVPNKKNGGDTKVRDFKPTAEAPDWGQKEQDQDQDMPSAPPSPGPHSAWEDDDDNQQPMPPVPSPKRGFGVRSNTPLIRRGRNATGAITPAQDTWGATTPGRNTSGAMTPGRKRRNSDSDDEEESPVKSAKKPRGIVEKQNLFELSQLGTPKDQLNVKSNWCTICADSVSSIDTLVRIHLKTKHSNNSFCCNYPTCKPAFSGSQVEVRRHYQSQHRKNATEDDYYRLIVMSKTEWDLLTKNDKSGNHSLAGASRRNLGNVSSHSMIKSSSGSKKPLSKMSLAEKAKMDFKGLKSWEYENKIKETKKEEAKRKKEETRKFLLQEKAKVRKAKEDVRQDKAKAKIDRKTEREEIMAKIREKEKSSATARKVGRPPKQPQAASSNSGAKPAVPPKKSATKAKKPNEQDNSSSDAGKLVAGRFCMICELFDPKTVDEKHLIRHANDMERCELCGFEWVLRVDLMKHYSSAHPEAMAPKAYDQIIAARRKRVKNWSENFLANQLHLMQIQSEQPEGPGMVCYLCRTAVNMMEGWGIKQHAKVFIDPVEFQSHVYSHSQWASAICNHCVEDSKRSGSAAGQDATYTQRFVIRSKFDYTDHLLRYHKDKLPNFLSWKQPEQLSKMAVVEYHIKKAFTTFDRHEVLDEKLENEIRSQIEMYEAQTGITHNAGSTSAQTTVNGHADGDQQAQQNNITQAAGQVDSNGQPIEFLVKQEPEEYDENAMEVDPTPAQPCNGSSLGPKASLSNGVGGGALRSKAVVEEPVEEILAGDQNSDGVFNEEEIETVEGLGGNKINLQDLLQSYDG